MYTVYTNHIISRYTYNRVGEKTLIIKWTLLFWSMLGYQFKDHNYNNNNKNKLTFPYTFRCRQCNEHHTALAFNDDDIDYLVLLLEQNKKQILALTMKKTNSWKDKRLLRRELKLMEYCFQLSMKQKKKRTRIK